MTKMTYADALARAIFLLGENAENDDVVNRLNALKMTLEKRALKERKPTKKHVEAEQFVKSVRDFVENHAGAEFIVSEVAKEFACTNQRIVSAFTKLVTDGVLIKGDGWYEIAEKEDE